MDRLSQQYSMLSYPIVQLYFPFPSLAYLKFKTFLLFVLHAYIYIYIYKARVGIIVQLIQVLTLISYKLANDACNPSTTDDEKTTVSYGCTS